jgi:hypothetical protein
MKCLKCDGDTIKHTMPDSGEECEREIIIGDTKIECISLGHESDEIWFICPTCKVYHLQCPKCLVYCRLIGIPGEIKDNDSDIDGKQCIYSFDEEKHDYVRVFFEGELEDIHPENCVILPATMYLYYLDTTQWYPTGMDGSRFTKWKCESCDYNITSFD